MQSASSATDRVPLKVLKRTDSPKNVLPNFHGSSESRSSSCVPVSGARKRREIKQQLIL